MDIHFAQQQDLKTWKISTKYAAGTAGTITKVGDEFMVVIGAHVSFWSLTLMQLHKVLEDWYWEGYF